MSPTHVCVDCGPRVYFSSVDAAVSHVSDNRHVVHEATFDHRGRLKSVGPRVVIQDARPDQVLWRCKNPGCLLAPFMFRDEALSHSDLVGHAVEPCTPLPPVLTESLDLGPNPEMVDHPKHYNEHPSGVECIEIVRHMNFNIGNAVKYLWRCGMKDDEIQELEKAKWYIEDEIKRRKEEAEAVVPVEAEKIKQAPVGGCMDCGLLLYDWDHYLEHLNLRHHTFKTTAFI